MSDAIWEKVCLEEGLTLVERLRVPGGWLYRTLFLGGAGAMCFVPEVEVVAPSELEAQRDEAFGLAALRANRIGALEKELAAMKEQLAQAYRELGLVKMERDIAVSDLDAEVELVTLTAPEAPNDA